MTNYVPIEETRCGSCAHFDVDCPNGVTRRTGKVLDFFAEKCSKFKGEG